MTNTKIQPIHRRLINPKETAGYLKLDENTITLWARKKYIPAHPLGEGKRKFWRFFEHEISPWLLAQSNNMDHPTGSSSIEFNRSKQDEAFSAPVRLYAQMAAWQLLFVGGVTSEVP